MANEMGFTMKVINTADIVTNAGYQRPIEASRVRRIVSHWNNNLVNPPKVSYRNGKFYVFDGQHTINALKLRNDGKDVDVLCRVYTGMTYEDEARMFAEQDGEAKNVNMREKCKALYEARDEVVLDIANIIMSHGYPNPTLPSGSKSTDRFRPIPTALRIYNMCGRNRFDTVMNIATSAWGATTDAARAGLLSGIDLLLTTYGNDIDAEELIKSLSRVSPLKLCADAKADTLHKGATNYAIQMAMLYNVKKRKNRLDVRELIK